MKVLTIVLFTICLTASPVAQAQNLATTIKVQAMDMGSAVMRNDFNVLAKYMHPSIIEFSGGKEKLKVKMDSAYSFMNRFGVSFKRYWIGSPRPDIEAQEPAAGGTAPKYHHENAARGAYR